MNSTGHVWTWHAHGWWQCELCKALAPTADIMNKRNAEGCAIAARICIAVHAEREACASDLDAFAEELSVQERATTADTSCWDSRSATARRAAARVRGRK